MASSYPGGLDALTNPTGSDSMASVSHAGQHANANDAIEAIQAELGTDPAGASATVAARFNTKVTKAASSTDNALARFDGTGGDTVQNSGVTADDSGNLSTPGTVAAAGLAGSLLSSANPIVNGSVAAGTSAIPSRQDHVHPTDTTRAPLASPTFTGTVTIPSGLVLGTVTHTEGTGSPQGVVTAVVGSTYVDTAATTGAIRWIKATGTGNTGWVVEYGDTGRRVLATGDITAATNVTATTSGFWLRRIGNTVTATLALTAGATIPSDTAWCNVAAGFRPTATLWGTSGYGLAAAWTLAAAGNFVVYTSVAAGAFRVSLSYLTTDAWPASLPGSAA